MTATGARLAFWASKVALFVYIAKDKTKCTFIRLTKGKEAEKAYILSKVTVPLSFYIHTEILRLYEKLDLDFTQCRLLVDLHCMGASKMDDPELRGITMELYRDFDICEDKRERKELILDYLVKSEDLTERFLDFKQLAVNEWLEETPSVEK